MYKQIGFFPGLYFEYKDHKYNTIFLISKLFSQHPSPSRISSYRFHDKFSKHAKGFMIPLQSKSL